MRIDIISIFPEMFDPVLNESMIKRAQEKEASLFIHDLRDFSTDKHSKVDDRPFGGGSGMVMTAIRYSWAVKDIKKRSKTKKAKVILLCPQGKTLTQARAKSLSRKKHLILICGHYEGVDERVREYLWMKRYQLAITCLPAESFRQWCWWIRGAVIARGAGR